MGHGEAGGVRVFIIGQQVGVDTQLAEGAAGAVIRHPQGRVFAGATGVVHGLQRVVGAGDGDRQQGGVKAAAAVEGGVGDRRVEPLAGGQLVKVAAGVEAPGAVGLEGENAALVAAHHAGGGIADHGGLGAAVGSRAPHLDDFEFIVLGVIVIEQQVGADAVAALVAIGHGQGLVLGGGAPVIAGVGGVADGHRQGGADGGAVGVRHPVGDAGGAGGGQAQVVKLVLRAEPPGAVFVNAENTAIVTGHTQLPGDKGAAGALLAQREHHQAVAVRVCVIEQQAGVVGAGADLRAGVVSGHPQFAAHRGMGDIRRHRRGRVAAANMDGEGGGAQHPARGVGHLIVHRGGFHLGGAETGEGPAAGKVVTALVVDDNAATIGQLDGTVDIVRAAVHLGDAQAAAVGAAVIQQQAGVDAAGALVIVAHVEVAGGVAGVVGEGALAGDGDGEAGGVAAAAAVHHRVGHRCGAAGLDRQVLEVGAGVKGPGAAGVDNKGAAHAAAHGAGPGEADGGGIIAVIRRFADHLADAEVVLVGVLVVQQQVALVTVGHLDGGEFIGAGGVVPGHRRCVDAAHGDREHGVVSEAAVADGVDHRGGAGLGVAESGEVAARVKAPGALGMDGELAAVAAGQQLADIGGAETIGIGADLSDFEVVAVQVTVVEQQVGVDDSAGAAIRVGEAAAFIAIGHRQGAVAVGGAGIVRRHRGGAAAVDGDREGGVGGGGGRVGGGTVQGLIDHRGGAGGVGGQLVKIAAGVKAPGAVGVDDEAAAVTAGDGAADIAGGQPGGAGADGADAEVGGALRVAVVEQQVGVVAGAVGGLAVAHGEGFKAVGAAPVIDRIRRVIVAAGDGDGEAGGDPGVAVSDGEADTCVGAGPRRQPVKIATRVKGPGAVAVNNEAAAIAAGDGGGAVAGRVRRGRVRHSGGALAARSHPGQADGEAVAGVGVPVIAQQAGVESALHRVAADGDGGGAAGGIRSHADRGVFRGAAIVVHRQRRQIGHHRDGEAGGGGAAGRVRQGVADPAGGGGVAGQLVKVAIGEKLPGAVGIEGEQAAALAAHRARHPGADRHGHAFAVGIGAGNPGDLEAVALRVPVVEQQVGIVTGGVGGLVVGHGQGLVGAAAAPVVGADGRVVGAGDGDRQAGDVGAAVSIGDRVFHPGFAGCTLGQVGEVAVRVKFPGAVRIEGELAAVAAGHRHADIVDPAGDPGNAEVVPVRVAVIQQQAGVEGDAGGSAVYDQAAAAADIIGLDCQHRIVIGGAPVGDGNGRLVGAAYEHREGGAVGGILAVTEGVGQAADGGFPQGQAAEFAVGVKPPGAVTVNGEDAAAAAGHRRRGVGIRVRRGGIGHIGLAAARPGDGEAVASIRVRVVEQQVGIHRGLLLHHAGGVIDHGDHPGGAGAARIVHRHRGVIGAGDGDGDAAAAASAVDVRECIAGGGGGGVVAGQLVKVAAGVEAPLAAAVDGEHTAAAAGQGGAVAAEGAAAHRRHKEFIAVGVGVVQQQVGVGGEALGGDGASGIGLAAGQLDPGGVIRHLQHRVFGGAAGIIADSGGGAGAHRHCELAVIMAAAVGNAVADAGDGGFPRLQVGKVGLAVGVAVGIEGPGAGGLQGEQAAAEAGHRRAHRHPETFAIGTLAAEAADSQLAVRVLVIQQQVGVDNIGFGAGDAAVRVGEGAGQGLAGAVVGHGEGAEAVVAEGHIIHRHRGVIGAGDQHPDAAHHAGLAVFIADRVGGQGQESLAGQGIVKVGAGVETPFAVAVNGEGAAVAAANGGGRVVGVVAGRWISHIGGALVTQTPAGGADGQAVLVGVGVILQQAGIVGFQLRQGIAEAALPVEGLQDVEQGGLGRAGGDGAGVVMGDIQHRVFADETRIPQGRRGVIDAADADREGGGGSLAGGIGDPVADLCVAGFVRVHIVKVAAGVEAPGAVALDDEFTAVAAAHRAGGTGGDAGGVFPAAIGGGFGAGHCGDAEAVILGVTVIQQQVGVDGEAPGGVGAGGVGDGAGHLRAGAVIGHGDAAVGGHKAPVRLQHRGVIDAHHPDGDGGCPRGQGALVIGHDKIGDAVGLAPEAANFGEIVIVAAGVKLPGAVTVDGEDTAGAARHRRRYIGIRVGGVRVRHIDGVAGDGLAAGDGPGLAGFQLRLCGGGGDDAEAGACVRVPVVEQQGGVVGAEVLQPGAETGQAVGELQVAAQGIRIGIGPDGAGVVIGEVQGGVARGLGYVRHLIGGVIGAVDGDREDGLGVVAVAVGKGVGDCRVAGGADRQALEVAIRVKAPGAAALQGEETPRAAPDRCAGGAGDGLAVGIGALHAGDGQGIVVAVCVVQQQVGIDAAAAGGVIRHGEDAVFRDAAAVIEPEGGIVVDPQGHREGGAVGNMAVTEAVDHRGGGGGAALQVGEVGLAVAVAVRVEAPGAVGIDDETAAVVAGNGLAQIARRQAGGVGADGGHGEGVAIPVAVVEQQVGIDIGTGGAGVKAGGAIGHDQDGALAGGAPVVPGHRAIVGHHGDREAGAGLEAAIGNPVADGGGAGFGLLEVVKVAAGVKTPGAAGLHREQAAVAAAHRAGGAGGDTVDIVAAAIGGGFGAGDLVDTQAAVRVCVIQQQVPVVDAVDRQGAAEADQAAVAVRHAELVGAGIRPVGQAQVIGGHRGVIGAADADRKAGGGGAAEAVAEAVDHRGAAGVVAGGQVVKAGAGVEGPGAVRLQGELTAVAAGHRLAHAAGIEGGSRGADGADADGVAFRVRVVQQQVGIGAATGAAAIGHGADRVVIGAAAVRQGHRGVIAAAHDDREGAGGGGAEAVRYGEGQIAGGGVLVAEAVEMAAGVKAPGAVGIDREQPLPAQAPHRLADIGRRAGHGGDGEGVVIGVHIIDQQAGVDAIGAGIGGAHIQHLAPQGGAAVRP